MRIKQLINPMSLLVGFIAIIGAVLIIINKGDYGLILLIIATLMEAMERVLR